MFAVEYFFLIQVRTIFETKYYFFSSLVAQAQNLLSLNELKYIAIIM